VGKDEDGIVLALDGQDLKEMIYAALSWLRQHQAAVNALNVFPVPDGDTGTNMTLTMTSAWEEIANYQEAKIGRMANKMAHGALMGARGNSGVILSQIWRGFARGLDDKTTMTAQDVAIAMHEAAETAYKGVVKPVEGTILTVVREVAEGIALASQENQDLKELLERMTECAKASVARTPTLLPVLRQAGVVDSGGQGLFIIFEGMLRYLKGLSVTEDTYLAHAVPLETVHPVSLASGDHISEELTFDSAYPYDVQFIVTGQNIDIEAFRSAIEGMGDCPLTVGDPTTVKVHVHVADPGIPISYAVKWGSLRDVVVEDMQAQYQEFVAARGSHAAPAAAVAIPSVSDDEVPNIGVVAVVAGAGLAQVFKSLGTTIVIEGGQTMNPSTAQILEAVERVPSDKVIILPNNKNIFMAAQQASEVSTKEVSVLPTRTIPQGIAALLSLDQSMTVDGNIATMLHAIKDVITGEVTWAIRNVALNGIAVREGDAIALLDGELVVDAATFEDAVHWLLAEIDLEDRELVTLYYGEGVDAIQAQTLADTLSEAYPNLEFEVIEGNQPHYPYILSVE